MIVAGDADQPRPWVSGAEQAHTVALRESPSDSEQSALRAAGCALVDGMAPHPVNLARRVHGVDSALQIVIVAPAEQHTALRRAMMFARGLGEVWITTPEEVVPDLIERATAVTRQRRSYLATQGRIDHAFSLLEPHAPRRAMISDAFLAALLGVLPDPVVSVDDAGRVLTWNAAAERVLGYSRTEVVGRSLVEMLSPDHHDRGGSVAELPARALRQEVRFRHRDGTEGIAELTVAPVEAAGHRVRTVVLRDVTDERRMQDEREAQAAELEALTEELQSHALQLEETQVELEMANDELQRTNAELAEQTQEAERERAAAEAANRAKSDFLATMSHEIRTPINAIMGYTDLIELGTTGPITESQRAYLGRVRTSSQHLLRLIEDILDLSKVEAGRMEVALERIAASQVIPAALALVAPQAAAKGIRVGAPAPTEQDTYFLGDEDRVRQILVNMLTNAVKFTDGGGTIVVSCGTISGGDAPLAATDTPAWTYFRVQDTGVGVAPEELDTIFGAFVQSEGGLTRTRGGTGLGLTISRQLARLMGGDLTVESELGVGSTFTLWLRREAVPDLPAATGSHGFPTDVAPRGIGRVGETIRDELGTILDGILRRLVADPTIPRAATTVRSELEDHLSTMIACLAQELVFLEGQQHGTVPLREGMNIRRVIAEVHGTQRARIGWTEGSLRRQFAILAEEVEGTIQRKLGAGAGVRESLALLRRFLQHCESVSVRSMQRAVAGD